MSRSIGWYTRRLQQMSAAEIAGRGTDQARHLLWAHRQVRHGQSATLPRGVRTHRVFATPLARATRGHVSVDAAAALLDAADRLLAGDWSPLGVPRPDVGDPDWFLDPATGRRAPQDRLAFRIDHRDEQVTGNVKTVWELSRHHHLTVLASAYWLTGEDRYAEPVARQLRSWWSANPFLSGIHWTSGIELGVRLISWAWIRRLLAGWPGVVSLFEENDDAVRQIWWHQMYLAAFPSRGSSANNHLVAEAAGRLVAACAFPWYAETDQWRDSAARQLHHSLDANTFASGINRELATDYHRFVAELGLVAAAEAEASGHPVEAGTWSLLRRSVDAAAALVDGSGRPPRQGDADEGRALVLDAPDHEPWALLLDLGAAVFRPMSWWPASTNSITAVLVGSLAGHPLPSGTDRPERMPTVFRDAGICLLRTPLGDGPEIWCRCDSGPHGFLSIAAHAHADALSVEVRYDGVEILVDPGTYCYHGEPAWRSYFRSTAAHNTLQFDGASQSVEGGPFLWSGQAETRTDLADTGGHEDQTWAGHVTGYPQSDRALRHARQVTLHRRQRRISVVDRVTAGGPHALRMSFHTGPAVEVDLSGSTARLSWVTGDAVGSAVLHLPPELTWSTHRGETDPIAGWYSPRFGERIPITTLTGVGGLGDIAEMTSTLTFAPDINKELR